MGKKSGTIEDDLHRRSYGVHLTSSDIFLNYIYPEIKSKLWNFRWVDLYAGEGNLILPLLDLIPTDQRTTFFEKHIYLSDIQEDMVKKCIKKAEILGIPSALALKNIKVRDNLESFPLFLKEKQLPIFHITNPPYLYLGYIKKHEETQKYLTLFKGDNEGYQDLYQIALINDLRNNIYNLIYIIPSNFLFGASGSNKFRLDFLKQYKIQKMIVFETQIFEFTGTNICIGFFKKKKNPKSEILEFKGLKVKKKNNSIKKEYRLKPKYNYRAGSEFDEYLDTSRVSLPLNVRYYLLRKEVMNNKGTNRIKVIDANDYSGNQYRKLVLDVSDSLKKKIEANILYVRTVDTGSYDGRVGLGIISEDFEVDGIYVSGNTYRTHPIQVFLDPELSRNDQILLKNTFNLILESFREKLDSEFLTTYKYSNAEYTRKYLGLTQTRRLIQTFPFKELNKEFRNKLIELVKKKDFSGILENFQACKDKSC
ncbi:MAG: N-6 DNA methylase [Promethearchaeota archaeon]|jgi:type I restriction-modification system DNA methylase subunit